MSDDNKTLTIGDVLTDFSVSITSTDTVLTSDYLTVSMPQNVGTYSLSVNGVTIAENENFEVVDPYASLEEIEQEKEKEKELRNKYPVLQEAYEHYQLIKKLVEDSEFDKSFEERYKGFTQ